MSTIAVVGATGTIGERLVGQLAARGEHVRAIARDPGSEHGETVEPLAADLTDRDDAMRALEGADRVYLTPPEGDEDPLKVMTAVASNAIEAATEHGADHVVMHTAVHGDRGDTGAAILDNKTPLEQALTDADVGHTILRPGWFMQNLWAAKDYVEQGVVSLPWPGDMAWAATDVNDIVAAALAFLEAGPADDDYDVHVPGGITGEQIADAASRVLDREVVYQQAEATPREFAEQLPIADALKDYYGELFEYFMSTTYLGDPEPITRALDGFEISGVEDFLRNELFAGR